MCFQTAFYMRFALLLLGCGARDYLLLDETRADERVAEDRELCPDARDRMGLKEEEAGGGD